MYFLKTDVNYSNVYIFHRFIEEKEGHIVDLENSMARIKDEAVDRESVLQNMQSDKTALSRAMAQNKQLKQQLSELQNGFVKMSNDNMEMMSGLTSEQHVSKELAARLSQQEDELKEIREQVRGGGVMNEGRAEL